MIDIDIFFLPGCPKCGGGLGALKKVAETFGPDVFAWNELDLLQNIDYAVQLGIVSAPAIAIGGKLAFTSLPSTSHLQSALTKISGK